MKHQLSAVGFVPRGAGHRCSWPAILTGQAGDEKRSPAPHARVWLISCCFAALVHLAAQPAPEARYTRTDTMIPMRDGVHLYTPAFAPPQATEKFPFLLSRTPYET